MAAMQFICVAVFLVNLDFIFHENTTKDFRKNCKI